jgi:hypothetical protein
MSELARNLRKPLETPGFRTRRTVAAAFPQDEWTG